MCNKDFVHLHAHTHFSVQDALPTPKAYATKAREMGFSATAITDHGKMGGVIEFVEGCRIHNDDYAPIKPIIGIEVYTCPDRFNREKTETGGRQKLNHLTLLAQNETGYKNLLALSALGNDPEAFYYSPRIDWSCLQKHSEGVIALSGCLASELNQSLMKEEYDNALSTAKKFKDLFDDRYFIELQYHGIEEQAKNMRHLIDIAEKIGSPVVASNDVHYLDKLDWQIHDVLIQMRDQRENRQAGAKKNGKKDAYGSHQFYLKSHDEMMKVFGSKLPHAVTNSVMVADMVDDFLKLDVPHLLPKAIIPENDPDFKSFWKTKFPYNKSNEAYLAYLTYNGLKSMGLDNKAYMKRLWYELQQIWYMGVTDYFLIQREMVEFMKSKDIYFGIRGSGVGSLVNYCLEVCNVDPLRWNLLFERFLNPGRGTQYKVDIPSMPVSEWKKEFGETSQIASVKHLRSQCKEWLQNNPDCAKYEPEIEKELWVLENQGLATYICDLADRKITCQDNNSQLWTAYITGITKEKPQQSLIVSKVAALPDVDTDIDDHKRPEVIQWTKERFGDDKVAQIGTWGRYAAKASVVGCLKSSERFQEKYPDTYHNEALKISALISKKPGSTIEETITENPEFAYHYKIWKTEIDNAMRLVGTISNYGIHASGVLVASEPISQHAPIENSKGNLCSAYDMKNVERMGLVKYDFLGLAALHQINLCINHIKKLHNKTIKFSEINLEDPKVFKNIYAKGKTSSVFQFASRGMQDALKKVNASDIEDLIAVAALYRPGPLEYIDTYAEGKKNPDSLDYAHPIIEKHLSVTYGIMVYQEQAMFLARDMAGFTWAEVDKLRKAISKKSGKDFDDICALFKKKSLEKNVDEAIVDEVLALMAKFGGYAFNRSHACAYALLSYWTAWLRNYYPSEWMAACIEIDKDDDDKMANLLEECHRDRIVVKDPNINESGLNTTVNKKGEILLPLSAVKGVGSRAKDIVDNQPYSNLKDFCYRARPNRGIVEALSKTTAFDCLPDIEMSEDEFMQYWDDMVLERNNEEKKKIRDEKRLSRLSVSIDKLSNPDNNKPKPGLRSTNFNSLFDDNLFD